MNRSVFFDDVRRSVFGGKLSQTQVDGLTRILDYRDAKYPAMSDNELAYVLATTKWETANTMQPVKEYGGKAYLKSKKYYPYYGRGLVQITWKANYDKYGITNPDDALKWPTALHVLFHGMAYGQFTGKKLADYIHEHICDYVGARRIINGTDKARQIAAIAEAFRVALSHAHDATVEGAADAPDKPTTGTPVSKSTTVGGAIVGGASGTIAAGKEIIESAKQATEVGKSAWDIAAQVGPWVVVALVIIAATCYIIYERRRHATENGI